MKTSIITRPAPAPVIMNERQAAEYVQLSVRTLQNMRVRGGGPAFVKAGARVLYELDDLVTWLRGNKRASTSET